MRLTPRQIRQVTGQAPHTPAPATNMLEAALALAKDGWAVFPLRPGSKVPLLPRAHDRSEGRCHGECGRDGHGAWDGTTDPDRIRRWWTTTPSAGIGANLGEDRLAIDIDVNHGGSRLDALPDTRTHYSGRGNGNVHLIYRFEPGTMAAGIRSGNSVLGKGIDIRAGRGSYIVMPPTLHEETGQPYRLGPENGGLEHVLTDEEVTAIYTEAGVDFTAKTRAARRGMSVVDGGKAKPKPRRSLGTTLLADLLANPPKRGSGQTNEWLTKVAGHYAKMHRDKPDLYEIEVRRAIAMVDPDYEDTDKIIDSIWRTETEAHPERSATLDNGYLVGNGRSLFCQVSKMEGDERVYELAPYGDFDIEARGVAVDELDRRMYWIRLYWAGREIDATLDSEILGDDRAIRKWLSARGASIDPPFNAYPKTSPGVRLLRYLNSQQPPRVQIVDTLGWHNEVGGFVTHDGVITADGWRSKEDAGVVADPHLVERDVAPYTYGFSRDEQEARRVLREVLTFQFEPVASVFGAWWAACLLRPQIQARSSLFPFFGVEATSESGKTNGFFDLMVQLNGNTRGQIAPTRPVLRDYASANRNGIVWADDLDSLEAYGELLRASTSNGTAAKMDIDRSGIKNTQVVAPILITGEALGMNDQKALADRSVIVGVTSPKDRMSLHGDWLQWEDVLELKAQYPADEGGLAVLAGWYVKMALSHQDAVIEALKRAKKKGTGRHGDKMAVLRAGAMLLDALVGHDGAFEGTGAHAVEVERWIQAQGGDRLDRDNTLTLKVLPWALRIFGFPEGPEAAPEMGRFAGIDTPVFVKPVKRVRGAEDDTLEDAAQGRFDEVWVSASLLATAWARDRNHRVEDRTETEAALRQQLDALEAPSKVFAVVGTRRKARYRRLPAEYSAAVLRRARG